MTLLLLLLLVSASPRASHAAQNHRTIAISGDRLSGFVLPIEPVVGDITLSALRADAWTVDDTKRLFMQGDVRVSIGGYQLQADQAVVWLNRLPSQGGLINQIALYFDHVRDPTKQAGLGLQGDQLLVTGSARGDVRLTVSMLNDRTPGRNPLLQAGEARLAEHLRRLAASPPRLANRPNLDQPVPPRDFVLKPGEIVTEADAALPERVAAPKQEAGAPWLASPQGIVRFSADHVELTSGQEENTIAVTGSIAVEYFARNEDGPLSQLSLVADRAVIFTDPGSLQGLASGELAATQIRGIYLEGNVTATTEGAQYVVRAPHVYYDFRTHQAIMLDAMLRVQSRGQKLPLYARAREMRQLSDTQWETKQTVVSTSDFYAPHLAIGSKQATITRNVIDEDGQAVTRTHITSDGNTLQASGVPFMYWPHTESDVENVPLRNVEVGTRRNTGLGVRSTWDLYTLMGEPRDDGMEADLQFDGFTERGPAMGLVFKYDVGDAEGRVDLYGLHDTGTDRTSSGRDVEPDEELRGLMLLEYQTSLSKYWSMQAQASLISDDTFITSWREDDFEQRREYETSLYLKHQRDNAALTLLGKYDVNGFISNDYLLASRQYSVDKVPEVTYRRYGDSLLGDRITYSTENRVTRMRMVFERRTPEEIGAREAAFGIGPDDSIAEALKARGLRSNYVDRFDSRHEFAMPLHEGPFNITPFVVGRFTAYDDDFEDFSSDSDGLRLYGAGGVRVTTAIQRVYDGVENKPLDLHRLRHLIEPYLVVWGGATTVSQDDLPTYDESVESVADGAAVELGVKNTWQTQRGGPGRWHSVDFFTLDTAVVLDTEGEANESPTPQFFDYRPEYSMFGDHVHVQAEWLITDSVSFVGQETYVLDPGDFARGSVGVELRHNPLLTTYVEYRHIDADNSELLGVGWIYQLTPKYKLVVNPQYDFREGDFRSFNFKLTRSFPDFDFTFQVRYDQIRDDTAVGASLGLAEF